MKTAVLAVSILALASPVAAQQAALDHAHMHDAQATPPAAATPRTPQTPPAAPAAPGGGRGGPQIDVPWNDAIPPGTADHASRALKESSRHGEWADIKMADATLKAWVVYPERAQKAGVVLVIHDIRGMSDMARALGDQLAQDGFIAVVPDFLSGKGPNGGGTDIARRRRRQDDSIADPRRRRRATECGDGVRQEAAGVERQDRRGWLLLGRCPQLRVRRGAAESQRGRRLLRRRPGSADSTQETTLANVKAPVLGLYAGNDARINATLPATQAAMQKLGKSYDVRTYEGAGHGFMFGQGGAGGANLKAAQESWPVVVQFFRKQLS